ncbi:hypothetical protein N8258_02840, partial [Algibacter sp.]|nr:hypothetical protein [Algibacter sp.]
SCLFPKVFLTPADFLKYYDEIIAQTTGKITIEVSGIINSLALPISPIITPVKMRKGNNIATTNNSTTFHLGA